MSGLEIADNAPVVRYETSGRVWRVSPALAGWLDRHVPADVRCEMIEFLVGDPIEWSRILMFARRIGVTDAPLIDSMTVESWGLDTVHAAANYVDGTCWTSNRFLFAEALPETVLADMAGRRFGDVVDNPYLPRGATIARAEADRANGGRAAVYLA